MSNAARDGNTVEAAMLNARYRAWLRDEHGITNDRWDDA